MLRRVACASVLASRRAHASSRSVGSFGRSLSVVARGPSTPESAAPAASDSSRLAANTRTASIAFARWLSGAGVRFNSAENRALFGLKRLASNPHEWFLAAASRDIAAGETVFRLPREVTIAPSTLIKEPRAARQVTEAMSGVPAELWPLKSGLRLLYEYALMTSPPLHAASADSFFAPYINLLPSAYASIPLFWSSAQVSALQYAPVETQVRLRSTFVRDLAPRLGDMRDAFGRDATTVASPERIAWAMSSASSRAFALRPASADVAGECVNLPLIDMMNHSFTNNCKVTLDPTSGDVCVVAVRNVPAGSELTLNYGWHSNDAFLLNYGFVVDENPADTLEVPRAPEGIEIARDMAGEATPPQAPWKSELASALGMGSASVSTPRPFVLTRDVLDPQLIAYARLLLAPADLPAADRNVDFFMRDAGSARAADSAATGATVSTQEWSAPVQDLACLTPPVARVLFSYLSLVQSTFATTLQQDVDELTQLVQYMLTTPPDATAAEAATRQELAIRFRINKKRILAEQMQRLQRRM